MDQQLHHPLNRFPHWGDDAKEFLAPPEYPLARSQGHLARFAKDMCANWDRHYQVCTDDQPCRVLMGAPCPYFEKSVLGPPDYPYKTPGYDYRKLFEQYGRINPQLEAVAVVIRKCDCGRTLQPRERICEKCRDRRRRDTYRESKRKHRQVG